MKHHAARLAAAVAVATTIVTGCAAQQHVALRDDVAITNDVQDRLKADPTASGSKIGVDTKGGVVSLSGVVAMENVRSSAEQIARDTPGVRSVDNNVRFGSAESVPAGK
jgi:osmotically-inducible protein OsmY